MEEKVSIGSSTMLLEVEAWEKHAAGASVGDKPTADFGDARWLLGATGELLSCLKTSYHDSVPTPFT